VDEIRALLYKRGLFVRRRSADGQLLHDTLEELFTFEYRKRPSKIFMNIAVDYEVVSRALNCRRLKAGSTTEFESIWDVAKHNQSIRSSVLLPRTNPNIVLHYILAVITLDGSRVVEIMDSLHDPFTYQYYRDLL
jgi:lambda repressor-like predicted transcriptional regulator